MSFYILAGLIDFLSASFFGLFVFFRSIRRKLNQLFLLMNFSVAWWALFYWQWLSSTNYKEALFFVKLLGIGSVLIPIFYLHWVLVLLGEEEKEKPIIIFGYLLSFIFLVFSFSPLFVKGLRQIFFFPYWPIPGPLYTAYMILGYGGLIGYGVFKLLKAYKKASGYQRLQIKYVLVGSFVGFLGGATNFPLWYKVPIPPFGNILVALYPFILSYAILRYRLMDMRLAIGRAGVYFLSLLSVLLFDYLLVWLNFLTGSHLSLKIFFPLAVIISIYLYKFFFQFYSKLASKYFYYSFYSFQKTLADLSRQISSILDIDKLSDLVITTLFKTLRLNRAVVLIKDFDSGLYKIKKNIGFREENGISLVRDNFLTKWLEEHNKPLIYEEIFMMIKDAKTEEEKEKLEKLRRNMARIEAEACLPLLYQNKLIGMIILSSKALGEPFSKEDIDLLTALASQASIAFENARLYSELKGLSEHLQEKVDEQTKNLRELLKTKDEFLHIVSHQLRTPLTVLRGYLHFWETGALEKFPREKQEKIKEYIIVSAERLHKIIKDMLKVVDLEGGRMVAKFEPVDVKKLIETIYNETLKLTYEEKGLYFKMHSTIPEGLTIESDPRFLEIAFQNILDNARKYTLKGGVDVYLTSENNSLIIRVKDTGIGFSKEDKERIFGKFIRGERAKNLDPNGTGLGLYVTKKIIETLGGSINIESEGEGKGSEVIVKLPLKLNNKNFK